MRKYAVLPEDEANQTPYPYVYINDNREFCELSEVDRKYLEEEFYPTDGARPYVKFGLYSETPDNKIGGFLHRSKLPKGAEPGDTILPRPWWRFWP